MEQKNSKKSEKSRVDEPFLIHSKTCDLLKKQVHSSDRNVLLTMNEYEMVDINPRHPRRSDAPTHIIILCVRFIGTELFQPIGGLQTFKNKDQSAILAECLKAFIDDLRLLGIQVLGTVSPPFENFKRMLSHLVDVKNFNTYASILTYSVGQVKEIVHIYDVQFLLMKLQNLFKEGDIKYVEVEEDMERRASWKDISQVLNLSSEFKTLSNYLLDTKDVSRRVHIFTQQILDHLLDLEAGGTLSTDAGGTAVLLSCIRVFLQFTELDMVDLNALCKAEDWYYLTDLLPTMLFQKSKNKTTKTRPTVIHVVCDPTTNRLTDFQIQDGPNFLTGSSRDGKKNCRKNKQKKDNTEQPKLNINDVGVSSISNDNGVCSQTDEEAENDIAKCDTVSSVAEASGNGVDVSEEFEQNDITNELQSTVFGMQKMLQNLLQRGVKVAKPNAFLVEHIDFFVTAIKRDKNKIHPVHYYGHNYTFLDPKLAFSTLKNDTGLFLVKP